MKITNLAAIARRYFVNNFYDGAITITGSLIAFLTIILKGEESSVDSYIIIMTGLGTCISMFISGFSGSYLSEKAEQKKIKFEIERAMGQLGTELEDAEAEMDEEEIQKAMLKKIKIKKFRRKQKKEPEEKTKVETLYEKAESLANKVVSLVNGGAPFLGGFVPLIPFFFVTEAEIPAFIISFIIILGIIVLLGVFLGKISKESILKNIFQMIAAFIITFLLIVPILLFTSAG